MPTSGMDYTKVENIFQPVSAAYASMRLGEGEAQSYVLVMAAASDDADAGSSSDDGASAREAFDEFKCDPKNLHVNNMWIYYYDIVSSANYAIESMDKFEEAISAAEALKTVAECRGEAKIIRAYAYFNLVRLFGSVPLIDRSMTANELGNLPASPVDKVYEFIYKDLDDAIEVVPEEHMDYKGRYNKYTAMALKSKVALYNKDWNEAAAQADAVMASRKYSLYANFREMFMPAGEYCSESLMEVGCDDLGQSKGNAPVGFYAFIQGPRNNQPSNMQGWGYKVPSQALVDFLTERGDEIRLKTTILRRGETTPEGDQILEKCANPYYNGKVYTPSKFNTWAYNGYGFDHNMRLLRYADVLLIYAEAMAQGASIQSESGYSAADALNEVRQRAGLAPAAADLQAIWDERRAELAMEENRFFDLVRTGQAQAVLGPLGFKTGKNEVFPTPATQIQVNTGLSQTPGYTY